MPDWSTMKLGKRPATIDRRTLRAEHYIDLSAVLPQVPDVIDWSTRVARFEMFLNDLIGDCVIAALAHQEEAVSAQNGRELVITDQDVLTGYEAVGGYVPGRPETDEGCDPLVALKWWRATGIAGNRIGAFVSVDPNNAQLVRAALYLFGGLFVGVSLPLTAQDQGAAGQPWDVLSTTGRGAPGSWGGHMVFLVRQRGATAPYEVVTWGMLQAMTQAFLATYSPAEVFAVIPQAWLNDHGLAPNGLNLAQLTADLAIVSGQQPDPTPPSPVATTTTLSVSPNPVTVDQPLTLSVAVAAADGSTPTGVVTITAGGQPSDSQLDATGRYNEVDSPTTAGSFTATAQYRGDATHEPSTAAPVTVTVQPLPIPQPTHFVPSGPTADAWTLLQQGGALAKAELALLLNTDPTGPAAPAWRYLLNGGDVQALLDAWGPYLHAEGAA